MIDRSHDLPVARQARELGISRGSIYYLPRPVPAADLALMRRIDVLLSQGRPVAEAIRTISVTAFTYYRWRKEFGGLKSDQVKRLKDLEKENERLRKAVSDLTLEKLILREAASGNY